MKRELKKAEMRQIVGGRGETEERTWTPPEEKVEADDTRTAEETEREEFDYSKLHR